MILATSMYPSTLDIDDPEEEEPSPPVRNTSMNQRNTGTQAVMTIRPARRRNEVTNLPGSDRMNIRTTSLPQNATRARYHDQLISGAGGWAADSQVNIVERSPRQPGRNSGTTITIHRAVRSVEPSRHPNTSTSASRHQAPRMQARHRGQESLHSLDNPSDTSSSCSTEFLIRERRR